jgi:protein-tyrosine kinase
MSRIEEVLKRAATGTTDAEGTPSIRDRFVVAARSRVSVDDFVAESPAPAPPVAAPPPAVAAPPMSNVEPLQWTPEPPVMATATSGPTRARVSPPVDVNLVGLKGIEPASVEQYRRLATSLHGLQRERGVKTVMVTSSVPREGKTLIAANLAVTLSESYGRRVLLIDADMRRPSVHELFGVPNRVGLGDGLRTPGTMLTLEKTTDHLTILTAGRPDSNPMAGLASERMRVVLKEAAERFDWVIVDTPPVGMLSDARLIASYVDGVVFVVGAGTTERQLVERAFNEIGRERIIGTVLNRVDSGVNLAPVPYYQHDDGGSVRHED